jgi:D-threo-aldose 1-dehydrogenase
MKAVLPGLTDIKARIGRTDVEVTRLGFGAAAMGGLYRAVSEESALASVTAAYDAGVRYFDTAPHYGFGLSETRLGAALGDLDPQERTVVSTKVGRLLMPVDADPNEARHGFVGAAPFEPVFDYSHDAVMRSFEESRRRLKRERIDILLAHDLGRVTHGAGHDDHCRTFFEGGYRAMRELRDSGVVGAIGLGVNEWQVCEEVLAHGDFDAFLLAGRYTLLEQTALDSFLPLCERRGCSIILGGPFNSGILVEGVENGRTPHYNYEPAPDHIVDRVRKLEAVTRAHGVPLAAAALQFPLAHGSVACVIPGMANEAQVAEALRLVDVEIPQALWRDLKAEGLLHPAAPTPLSETVVS